MECSHAIEINWPKLGLQVQTHVGSFTAEGIRCGRSLHQLIENYPRIVEGYETLGTFQYFVKVVDSDASRMRSSILSDIDPLATELTVSLVTKRLKEDYSTLLHYLRETNFPRIRALSDHFFMGNATGTKR